jgi:cysteine-rich repeat protein
VQRRRAVLLAPAVACLVSACSGDARPQSSASAEEGFAAGDAGDADTFEGACSDGERCDARSADGCNPDCGVDVGESGTNDHVAQEDPYVVSFVGEIFPAADTDLVELTVTEPATALTARLTPLGPATCASGEVDSVLEILDQDGTILGLGDGSGSGMCPKLMLPALYPGHYFARVSGAVSAMHETFAYVLSVALDPCGNGHVSDAEDCDDRNTTGGDGCSATCEAEDGRVPRY